MDGVELRLTLKQLEQQGEDVLRCLFLGHRLEAIDEGLNVSRSGFDEHRDSQVQASFIVSANEGEIRV